MVVFGFLQGFGNGSLRKRGGWGLLVMVALTAPFFSPFLFQ
jgi:hypothetical protein